MATAAVAMGAPPTRACASSADKGDTGRNTAPMSPEAVAVAVVVAVAVAVGTTPRHREEGGPARLVTAASSRATTLTPAPTGQGHLTAVIVVEVGIHGGGANRM